MRLAFIGTGKIINEALVAAEPLLNIEKTAIFARKHSLSRGRLLSAKYGIEEVYTDYDKLLKETSADTVYIGLINSVHYLYAKKALLCKKNVILEKPFCGFYSEAKELRDIAEENHLIILEAITVLHSDIFAVMKKNLCRLGKIKTVFCSYPQYSSRYDDYLKGKVTHTFDPSCCGGALYDINVYNIHYCVGLFGSPLEVHYYPNFGPNKIDTSGTAVLIYDGFTAICAGAKDSDGPGCVCVMGENGWMKLDGKPNFPSGLTIACADLDCEERTRDKSGAAVRKMSYENIPCPGKNHRMTHEFKDFARIIDDKNSDEASGYMIETLEVMNVLEKARKDAGIDFF